MSKSRRRSAPAQVKRDPKTIAFWAFIAFALVVGAGMYWATSARGTDESYVSSYTPETPVQREVAAFIGDSYTAGVGASSAGKRWTTLLSTQMDWAENNLGRGGTGFVKTAGKGGCGLDYCPSYPEMVSTAVQSNPAIVVVAGGQNDLALMGADPVAVTDAVANTYAEIRRQLPDARIIAVGPSVPAPSPHVDALDRAVRDAASSVGGEYISLLAPPVVQPDMLAADGQHVTDTGHAAIAERVISGVTST